MQKPELLDTDSFLPSSTIYRSNWGKTSFKEAEEYKEVLMKMPMKKKAPMPKPVKGKGKKGC